MPSTSSIADSTRLKCVSHIVDTLSQNLHKDDQLTAFLLVTPTAYDWLTQGLIDQFPSKIFAIHVQSSALTDEQRPLLIQLNAKAMDLLVETVLLALEQTSNEPSAVISSSAMGGWLLSKASGEAVARHLAACMGRVIYEDNRWRFFRWQDRRVLEWMWPSLSQDQQNALLGPIQQWWTLDQRNQLRCHESISPHVKALCSPGFLLNTKQRQHARQCALAQTVITGWLTFCPGLPSNYSQIVRDIINLAVELGLENDQDVALVAAYSLQVHLRLLTHPKIKAAIEYSHSDAIPLSRLIGAISDAQWEIICADLGDSKLAPRQTTGGGMADA